MIIQDVYLEDWDWHVTVYYAVDTYYIEDILSEIKALGADTHNIISTEELISKWYDVGLTYSNLKSKRSVLLIGISTCPAEFQNTFDHEKGHLAMHIAERYNIDLYGEEFQYLTGEIGRAMYPVAKTFLCN